MLVMTLSHTLAIERRAPDRVVTPSCPDCGKDAKVVGVIRRPQYIYFRCTKCGRTMLIDRPFIPLRYGLVAELSD
jgi:tRNA(Ile2) C34 agmatinyltransferase TiaS